MFNNCPPPNPTKAQYCISEKRPRMYCILLNSVIFCPLEAFINYVGIEEGGLAKCPYLPYFVKWSTVDRIPKFRLVLKI